MVRLRVVNPFSGRHEVVGEVTTADWASDSFGNYILNSLEVVK